MPLILWLPAALKVLWVILIFHHLFSWACYQFYKFWNIIFGLHRLKMAASKVFRFVTSLPKVECIVQDQLQIIKFMEGAPR